MAIRIRSLTHRYQIGTPQETAALRGINLEVARGSYVVLIGHVGSGKSTLIQHLNGLIRPQAGDVWVLGTNVGTADNATLRKLRQRVGLVFQYPEHQLFAETVAEDIAFGPRNMGLEPSEVERRVQSALDAVDLPRDLMDRSPFTLSGGQRRRVALAGVLAMEPDMLVLDEPAAGLDPVGRRQMLDVLDRWHQGGRTVVLATHDMDIAARRAQQVVVLKEGRIFLEGAPRTVFRQARALGEAGLEVPQVTQILLGLRHRGWDVRVDCLDVEEAAAEVLRVGGKARLG